MNPKYSISCIIPVHHQALLVDSSVNDIKDFLEDHSFDYEIILIDSGGNDGSSEKCDSLANGNSRIQVIHDSVNTKLGAKFRIGYRKAIKDLVWTISLDVPYPLETILKAESLFDKYDAVLSYRSSDPRELLRKLQSFIYNLIIRLCLRIKVKHINSAFRIYKREFIQKLDLVSDGWFIDAEVLYYITVMEVPYIEIPVPLVLRDNKYKSSVGVTTFIDVLWEMFYFIRNKKI